MTNEPLSDDVVYEAAGLAELGVTRTEFDADPEAALDRIGQYDARDMMRAGLRPLLPAQVRLRTEWERVWKAEGNPAKRWRPLQDREANVRTPEKPKTVQFAA